MESNLVIKGLGVGLEYVPGSTFNPSGGGSYTPGLYPPSGGTTLPSGGGKSKGGTMNTIKDIAELAMKLGLTAVQIKTALDGKQPITIVNPTTGNRVDLKEELEKRAVSEGVSSSEMMQMMQMMMMNQNKPEPKSNTALYVGIGVGVVAIGGLVFYAMSKNKSNNKK